MVASPVMARTCRIGANFRAVASWPGVSGPSPAQRHLSDFNVLHEVSLWRGIARTRRAMTAVTQAMAVVTRAMAVGSLCWRLCGSSGLSLTKWIIGWFQYVMPVSLRREMACIRQAMTTWIGDQHQHRWSSPGLRCGRGYGRGRMDGVWMLRSINSRGCATVRSSSSKVNCSASRTARSSVHKKDKVVPACHSGTRPENGIISLTS
jgi:hypothetical protein